MRDKEVLLNYREGMRELRVLEKQIVKWSTSGEPRGIGRVTLTGLPRGTNHPQAADDQHLDGLTEIWENRRAELVALGTRFEEILMEVKSARLRLVLRCYYGLGMTDERIAQDMEMSVRRVNWLRNGFMKTLDLKEAA